jgi:hypothetical protein
VRTHPRQRRRHVDTRRFHRFLAAARSAKTAGPLNLRAILESGRSEKRSKTAINGRKPAAQGFSAGELAKALAVHNRPLAVDGSDADAIGFSALSVRESATPPSQHIRSASLGRSMLSGGPAPVPEPRSTMDGQRWAYATLFRPGPRF